MIMMLMIVRKVPKYDDHIWMSYNLMFNQAILKLSVWNIRTWTDHLHLATDLPQFAPNPMNCKTIKGIERRRIALQCTVLYSGALWVCITSSRFYVVSNWPEMMHLFEILFNRTRSFSVFKSQTNQQRIKGFKGAIEGKGYHVCVLSNQASLMTKQWWWWCCWGEGEVGWDPPALLQWFMSLTELNLGGNQGSNTLFL